MGKNLHITATLGLASLYLILLKNKLFEMSIVVDFDSNVLRHSEEEEKEYF